MAKFTDGFFSFPIKIYDGASLKRAMEASENTGVDTDADWIAGTFRLNKSETLLLSWYDGFSRGRTVEEVNDTGFDLTIVFTPEQGELTCTWPRSKFERELDKFMERQPKEEDLVI